jgi:signal transduction histidine kinase
VCLAGGALPLAAQPVTLSLEQAGSRRPPEYAPTYEGQEVVVQGEVPYRAIRYAEYSHLHIQDETFHGLTLEASEAVLAQVTPGDVVEVRGRVSKRAGLPIILVSGIKRVGSRPAQAPQRIHLEELAGWRYLGVLVNTEGQVEDRGFDGGGEYLILSDRDKRIRVFMPRTAMASRSGFARFRRGDRLRVAGFSSQFCAQPPYTEGFEVVLDDPEAVSAVESASMYPPLLVGGGVLALVGAFAFWRFRERRAATQRAAMRSLNALGEEIIGLSGPQPIVRRLNEVLPKITGGGAVKLYLYRRASRCLERFANGGETEAAMVSLTSPGDPIAAGAALCFKNRTTLSLPDARRNPFFRSGPSNGGPGSGAVAVVKGLLKPDRGDLPRSVLLVPMFAQNECLGVLEIDHVHGGRFLNRDEQGAAQHLANQVATSLKLQEQHSMQEQLFRTEKLAAAGQLISGVADELRAPLRSIASLAHVMLERCEDDDAMERDLRAITLEALRAGEMVEHLVSFTRVEEAQAKTLDLHRLILNLSQFREREWKKRGVQVRNRIPAEPLMVIGSQSQLEQVFLNLLVHAEQSMTHTRERTLSLTTAQLGKRVLVEIAYSDTEDDATGEVPDPFHAAAVTETGALGLGVSRGILQSHGGDIRLVRVPGQGTRFEVELPLAQPSAGPGDGETRRPTRPLTVLLVEPDATPQRQLVTLLSTRGHRVVPVSSGEEVMDLVQRLRFDALFCSLRLPGMNWVELFERVRNKVGSFVLLTEGFNGDLARAFHGSEGFLLSKPVQEVELVRLLETVETRSAGAAAAR